MESIRAIAIIPARLKSTRLPNKALLDINGKTLLQRVWENACHSKILNRILIATDDKKIEELCFNIGAEYIMTPETLQSGTDRVIYAFEQLKEDYDYIVNLQGDEPLLRAKHIDELIINAHRQNAQVTTLITKFKSNEELFNINNVKVVINQDNIALYFSRAVIPYIRDVEESKFIQHRTYWKHIGIYCYNKIALKLFASSPPSKLEQDEKLEQLRLLENYVKILCIKTDDEIIGVDTYEDYLKVKQILSQLE